MQGWVLESDVSQSHTDNIDVGTGYRSASEGLLGCAKWKIYIGVTQQVIA